MKHSRPSFTLIEVVIALTLMVFIGAAAVTIIAGVLNMRDYLDEADLADRSARVSLAKTTKQLRAAFLTENTDAINTYQTVFIGRDNGDRDTLWFSTLGHRRMYYGTHEGDQAEITLWTEQGADDNYILFRRESARIDEDPEEGGTILPMASGVNKFNLQYLDGSTGSWSDEWDSTGNQKDTLPRAVQIHMSIMTPDPDDPDEEVEQDYLTTVLVDLAEPMGSDSESVSGDGLPDSDTETADGQQPAGQQP